MFQWAQDIIETVVMPADHPKVLERRAVCATCPSQFKIPLVGALVGSQCIECGCLIDAKTRTIREKCPRGYW